MKEVTVTITLSGELPDKMIYTDKERSKITERIKDSIIDILGEYEIWGESYAHDEEGDSDIYALFLRDVKLTRNCSQRESKEWDNES
jgi:hypothetical protein